MIEKVNKRKLRNPQDASIKELERENQNLEVKKVN